MQIGFKKLLLITVPILVGLSVSLTSYLSYVKEKKLLTTFILEKNSAFVQQQAKLIDKQMNEKALGLAKIAKLYYDQKEDGSIEQFVKLTETIASAMNLNSSAIGIKRVKRGLIISFQEM